MPGVGKGFMEAKRVAEHRRSGEQPQRLTEEDNGEMANLVMVYGMRLLPADEVAKVGDAPVELKNGNEASVTMHVLEGSREQIEAQLRLSIDAFFDFYPER
jgi:hypothetical protein